MSLVPYRPSSVAGLMKVLRRAFLTFCHTPPWLGEISGGVDMFASMMFVGESEEVRFAIKVALSAIIGNIG